MQSKKSQEATQETKEREYLNVESFEILRAREAQKGRVWADLKINGISIYGFQVVPRNDGSGDFLSWPSYKGSDGKYYNSAFAYLRPETQTSILQAIQAKLDE